jgi:hypothetical protein
MTNDRSIASQRYIQRTIIDGVVPDLVKAKPDIHWLERWDCRAKLRIEITNESSSSDRMIAHSAFEEITAHSGLRKNRYLRPRVELIELPKDLAELRNVTCVVTFARLELNDCKVH